MGSLGSTISSTLRDNRWARWTLNIALLAAVSLSLVSRAQILRHPTVPPAAVLTAIAPPSSDVPAIVSANLFGVDQVGPSGMMARSTLNLVVTGLFATGTSGGIAVMSVDGQPETAFATGDEILPGVRLHAVEDERVIVSRSGLLETVPLKEFVSSGKSSIIIATAETSVPGSVSPWAETKGFRPMAANSLSTDGQTAAPGPTKPAGPPNLNRPHKKNGAAGPGATGAAPGSLTGPQAGPPAGKNIEVPRPPTGGNAPQVPRPPAGTSVPDVPRPAPGSTITGPPLPTQK